MQSDFIPAYSREFCEPQYDPYVTAPDGAQVMELRLALAAQARERLPGQLDVPYGSSEKERLDIFPASGRDRPVMVFIHGGYWQRLDKSSLAFLAPGFVEAGVTLVLVNYNLAPSVTLDKIVRETRNACAWVWQNIRRFGGDPERIFVSGNSAGGHLTAMMAATKWEEFDPSLPPDLVKGASAISGIFDLEPLLHTSINDAVGLDLQAARRNSPLFYPRTMRGPLLIPVGALESPEFQRQSSMLAKAWSHLPTRHMVIPGCHHYNILLQLTHPDSELFRATLGMMGSAVEAP